MPEHEALILFDCLDAFVATWVDVVECAAGNDIDAAWKADHAHLVAHSDLYRSLHRFSPKARAGFNGRLCVEADSEGGIFFRDWTTRAFDPAVEMCSPN